VLLEAKHSGSCEGKVTSAYGTGSGISEAAITVLATLTVCESPADALWHVPKVQTSVVTSFEGLHLPCSNRHISSSPTFVKIVVPSSGRVLIINDPLYSQMNRFFEVGNIETENSTKHIGFSESIGCYTVFVDPVLVSTGRAKAALVLYAVFDEINHSIGDSFPEFLGERGFAVTKIGQQNQTGLSDLMASTP
tara:strand:- start:44 stop:622 length:579 start_codon:yes stop_codon:yes gene_type:complete